VTDRPPTDADCIRASLANPARFATIFDRHGAALAGYLAHRVPPSAVEDLASETFLAAFKARVHYDLEQADARPWLLGIATNTLRHHWRAEGRRQALVERLYRLGRRTPGPGGPSPGDPSGSDDDEGRTRVLAALDQLDPGIRDTLMLLAVGGLTYDEVARALDVPVGTVRSRIFRGRRRLRELLREDAPVGRAGVGPTGGSPVGPGSGSTEGSKEESHG
jgi:RNA polymerase sigma-70 factor (ECF subfamily)